MKRILLAIHELSYTGAPVSVKNMGKVLKKNNYSVEVWSYLSGPFEEEFRKLGIHVNIVSKEQLADHSMRKRINEFDLIIANTICTHEFVKATQFMVPTIWYIHEAENLPDYFWGHQERYRTFLGAANLYSVSEYAQDFIAKRYHRTARVLHNFIDDKFLKIKNNVIPGEGNAVRLLAMGAIIERKAFDVFLHAFMTMDPESRSKCEIHLAGSRPSRGYQYSDRLMEEIEHYPNIFYHGEIQDSVKVMELIGMSDAVVVPSKDEACSLVALEGAMMGKPLILSRNVGAKYIVCNDNGWVTETGNIDELRAVFQQIIHHPECLKNMGEASRRRYLETSTEEVFEKNLINMISESFVVSKLLFRVKQLPGRLADLGFQKTLNPYPYEEIKRNSRIILYGAGANGKLWYDNIKASRYSRIVLWVDQNHNTIRDHGIPVKSPDEIINHSFDFVLISVLKETIANEITDKLITMGIDKSKIKLLIRKP